MNSVRWTARSALVMTLGLLWACVGVPGAMTTDAGTPASGGPDASQADAGGVDAGPVDAGPVDAGLDASVDRDAGPRPPYDGGPIVISDFIAAMTPNSWAELPNTKMNAVCPNVNHYLCEAITNAWGGAAYDSTRDRLVVFGGGHSDSYVNDVFVFDLGPAKWTRWTEMPAALTGDAPPAVFQDKRVETCGLYPKVSALDIPDAWLTPTGYVDKSHCDDPELADQLDPQQPRSTHSYGTLAVSASSGQFYVLGFSAIYPSGQSTSSRVMALDFDSGQWARRADNQWITIGAASAGDPEGHLYYFGNYAGVEYDPAADHWTPLPGSGDTLSYYSGAAVDSARHELMLTSDGLTLQRWALTTPRGTRQALTSNGLDAGLPSQLAFEYDSRRQRYFAWSGGTSVYWLEPSTLTWSALLTLGDDPGGHPLNGVYGRLRYSPKYDVYVLVRDVTSNVLLYKPPNP